MAKWITSSELKSAEPQEDAVVRKYGTLDKLEMLDEPRKMRFVISTGDVDRDNDIIEPKGWELSNYRKNPIVLWAHSQRDLPIARCVELMMEDNKLVAVAEFAQHQFAQTVYELLKGGFLRATSVGFRVLEYSINAERGGVDFKRQELLEFSVVPVPANQNALAAASLAHVDLEPLRKWMAELLADWPGELKLPGKAWEKVLGAAAKHAGEEPPVERTVRVGNVETTFKVNADDAMAELDELEAKLERIEQRTQRVTESLGAAQRSLVTEAEDPDPEPDPSKSDSAATDDELVLELADEPDELSIDVRANELRELLRDVVVGGLRDVTQSAVQQAINQSRGRLD